MSDSGIPLVDDTENFDVTENYSGARLGLIGTINPSGIRRAIETNMATKCFYAFMSALKISQLVTQRIFRVRQY